MADATEPAASDTAPDKTPAAPEGGALEGEDVGSLVGIMYSDRPWAVPRWLKAGFFWVVVLSFGGLAWYSTAKRVEFHQLMVEGAIEPEPWGNRTAPSVALSPGEGGAPVDIATMRGKWVLLNFWATWCAPCRDEMPSLEMLNRRFTKDGSPVQLVAVSVDDDWAEVGRFFGATAPTFAVVWDKDKKTAFSYGSRKFPETFLINPEGVVVAKFTGPRDWYTQGAVQYFDEVFAGKRKAS
ncbi:MAG: redoxin domain-containing protein [Deltaproteobacteria bacterium]|nr:redoxin domain-containing protein [Deltaproteobacteria bacterium]